MKKIITLVLILIITINVPAQMIVSDPKLEAGQAKQGLVQKIMEALQKESLANTIDIKKSQETLTKYTKDYHEALKAVSDKVANSKEVTNCINIQKMYVTTHFSKLIELGNKLKGNERNAFQTVMKAGLKVSFDKLSNLKIILKSDYYKMSDNERLTKIQVIQEDLAKSYNGMLAFCKSIQEMIAIRDLSVSKPIGDYKKP